MNAKLNDELRQALAQSPEQPLTVEDPDTHAQYVLIRMDVYENLRSLGGKRREPSDDVPRSDATDARLPDWCNVYEGMSDDDIRDVETVALNRADLTRPS